MRWIVTGLELWLVLDKDEKVRMNRLVQTKTRLPAFQNWYKEMSSKNKKAFIESLFRYGAKNNDAAHWTTVLKLADLDAESDIAQFIWRHFEDDADTGQKLWDFDRESFIDEDCSEDQLAIYLRLAVHFFGHNEQEQMKKCGSQCDHWWHQLPKETMTEKIKRSWRGY